MPDESVSRPFCKLRHEEFEKLCDEKHKGVDIKLTDLEKTVDKACKKIGNNNKLLFGLLVAVITTLVAVLIK